MTTGPDSAQPQFAVCVVEHHPLATLYLEQILRRDPALETLSRVLLLDTAADAPRRGLHVFILDLGALPSSLDKLLRFIHVRFRRAKVILLGEPQSDDELCRLLFLGIQGFLAYEDTDANLIPAVRAVADGHYWVPQRVLEQYMRFSARLPSPRSERSEGFTWRERRIIELVKRRLSNKEISAILSVSEGTVKFHLSNIFAKLGVRDRHAMIEVTSGHPHPLTEKPK